METSIRTLQDKIKGLLQQRNAILLVHNYEPPEVQDIADLCGDSLELSIKASQTDAEVIVFCGVHFMAETASILCPDKKVLLPVANAGCQMADMITAAQLIEKKKEIPNAVVISYVNTTAEVKAESDICCTSANAVQVAESVDPAATIMMTPDKNLARYTAENVDREIIWWDGYCPFHNSLTAAQVTKMMKAYPGAVFLAHPECRPEVLALAHEVKSTSGMISYATNSSAKVFIIGTEVGIIHPLSKVNPDKLFIPAYPLMICPDMKKIGLREILASLSNMEPEVKVSEEIRLRAKGSVDRMLAIPLK